MTLKVCLKYFYQECFKDPILDPILFNIFINDLLFFTNEAKLANFANDYTIYALKRDLN